MKNFKIQLKSLTKVLGLICVCLLLLLTANGNENYVISASSNLKTEIIKGDDYDTLIESATVNGIKINVSYPIFNNSSNKQILKFVNKTKEEFKQDSSLLTQEKKFSLSFKVYKVTNKINSVVFNNTSNRLIKAFILNDNKNINQTQILKFDEKSKNKLYNLLLNEFKNSENARFLLGDKLKEHICGKDNFVNFFLQDSHLVFLFEQGEVTAETVGTVLVKLPLVDVAQLLTDNWRELLGVSLPEPPQTTTYTTTKNEATKSVEKKTELSTANATRKSNNESNGKRVALTFDDGPNPNTTVAILKLLDKYDVKATFFMLGENVSYYPKTAKLVLRRGHEIGNHTVHHKDLTRLTKAKAENEINQCIKEIKNATGFSPTLLRPPYGSINNKVKKITESLGLRTILWSVDTLDWSSKDPKAILNIVKRDVQAGSVILMHDIYSSTVEAVDLVLQYLTEEGYEVLTVSQLYDFDKEKETQSTTATIRQIESSTQMPRDSK